MPELPPDITANESSTAMLARMKAHPALAGMAVGEPSMPHAALSPPANEIAEGYRQLAHVVELRSLIGDPGHVAYGPYLDQIGVEEMGLARQAATHARVILSFTGTPGALVPAGTVVVAATPARPTYTLESAVTIGAEGTAGGIGVCDRTGTVGNVPSGAVNSFNGSPPAGVTAVTNPFNEPLVQGADIETDDHYRQRLLEYRRDPPNGCNAAQFRAWAESVPGVGRAQVVRPFEDGGPPPGSVWVFVVDTEMQPASQVIVDAVQAYIAPASELASGAGAFTGGTPQPDGSLELPGGIVVMATSPFPAADAKHAGIWTYRPSLRVDKNDDVDATQPAVTIDVWNVTTNAVATARPPGAPEIPATLTLTPGDLQTAFPPGPEVAPSVDVYWNGTDTLTLRVSRTATQAAGRSVYLGGAWMRSAFSSPDHEGVAPVDDRVEVYSARGISIDVTATVWPVLGYAPAVTEDAVHGAVVDYFKLIALTSSNDVIYGAVGAVIQATDAVDRYDPSTLRVNGATVDVAIWKGDVAILGTLDVTVVSGTEGEEWLPTNPPG